MCRFGEDVHGLLRTVRDLARGPDKDMHMLIEGTNTMVDRVALAYLSLSLEHREVILLLVEFGASASATALHHLMLEAFISGVWIETCATDKEIDETATFTRSPSKVVTMIRQLRKDHDLSEWFRILYEHYGIVGDYAHGHLRQLSRWLSRDGVDPRYSDEQMIELLWNADVVGLLASCLREKLMDRSVT